MLEHELAVFKNHKAELRIKNPLGGFVVIKEDEILGVWLSRVDALKEGINKYGNVPFLIRNINENEVSVNFTRNLSSLHAGIPQ